MAYAEKLGKGYRARYLKPDGTYGSEPGFRNRTAAKKWGDAQEEKMAAGTAVDPKLAATRFGDWVETWYEALDLSEGSMETYATTLNTMILPFFKDEPIGRIRPIDVANWKKKLRKDYKPSSIATASGRLHTIMDDAIDNGLIGSNPAISKRKRGKEEDHAEVSEEEEVWTTSFRLLLIAERCGILGGRDADFLFPITLGYTGMRLGEARGLEKRYCRAKLHSMIRVEWQLTEVKGVFRRKIPKKNSRGDVLLAPFLAELLTEHAAATSKNYCSCPEPHDERPQEYLFLGPEGGHLRRSNYYRRQWTPAVEGRRPVDGGESKPVYVRLDGVPWPGVPVVGRNNAGRADAAWLPIEPGMTPHGCRHSAKTWMIEDEVPEVASYQQLRHKRNALGGIRAVYSHTSEEMQQRLLERMERRWQDSLAQRAAIDLQAGREPHSPVAMLDRLLEPWREGGSKRGDRPVVVELQGGRRAMAG